EDAINFRLKPVVVPGNGAFEAWVYLDPKQPPTALAVQLAGGKKVWWGKEPTTDSPYAGGGLGTHVGALPAPGAWAKLSVKTTELGLKDGQLSASLTLQEYGGVVYWDAVALKGELPQATDPLASFRAWWKGLNGKPPPELPSELNAVAAAGPG